MPVVASDPPESARGEAGPATILKNIEVTLAEPPSPSTPVPSAPTAAIEDIRLEVPVEAPSKRSLLGWIGVAGLIVLILSGVGVLRDKMVSAWPPAGRFYAAIGWPAPAGVGLRLSTVTVALGTNNGKPTLTLTGSVTNHAWVTLQIPKLHVLLVADTRKVLRTVDIGTGKPPLHPGETTGFSLDIDDPPPEASSARVIFVGP